VSRTSGRGAATLFWSGSGIALALVAVGWMRHPDMSLLSVFAAATVLVIYAWGGPRAIGYVQSPSPSPSLAVGCGLLAGLIFAAEIALEYVLTPRDNSSWGLIEFGSVFAIYAAVGGIMAARGEPLGRAVTAAILAAMISSIIWCIWLLGVFHLFEGTARQTSVLLSEGDFEDFRRSGMASFSAFMIEDLYGAVFFHLLLGPLIALLLASAAWFAARLAAVTTARARRYSAERNRRG
jgi:hypothetical protein